MKSRLQQYQIEDLWQVLRNLGLIAIGSALCAVAINGILIPREFLSAGFVGLSLVIYNFVPSLPVAWLYFLMNVPLFAIGWRFVDRRFFLYSLAGMVIFSFAVELVQISIPVQDKILSALLAGIITGTGAGIILRSLGSTGGLDILCVIMRERFSVRLGTTSLAFNSMILVVGAILFSLERALYTLIYVYVTSHILNLVVVGLSQRKSVFIISSQWKEISKKILREIDRGLTIIKGQGGYTGQEENIIYTVITFLIQRFPSRLRAPPVTTDCKRIQSRLQAWLTGPMALALKTEDMIKSELSTHLL